jgi:hypothetical protein
MFQSPLYCFVQLPHFIVYLKLLTLMLSEQTVDGPRLSGC